MKTIVWMREDLRLRDNPALAYAVNRGKVLLLYIFPEGMGSASHWWLHQSLESLSSDRARHHQRLVLRTGNPSDVLKSICNDCDADKVVWNRVYSPQGIELGKDAKKVLDEANIESESFNGQLLIEPTKVLNQQGDPYKVFTPFWRSCVSMLNPEETLEVPVFTEWDHGIDSEELDDWGLLPTQPDWSGGLAERWQPGEKGAQNRWAVFLDDGIHQYKDGRDIPSEENTSMLSPHLTFGEISVRQIWHDVQEAIANQSVSADNGKKYLSEIGWREFSRYLLVHFPNLVDEPFNSKFEAFPWQNDPKHLKAWQQGMTGYPIVDAGMRELWHTGFMHNRVRMVVASFLTKHQLTNYEKGMAWFWDTLVDADIGNNTASWQWAAGCGADAAPYFRIFNPILQGEKFDKQGTYIRRWVPELSELDNKYINKPWEAGDEKLSKAGITLGVDYPYPIVEHKTARKKALEAYQAIKES